MQRATAEPTANHFAGLIAPVPNADFFARYFERAILHVARSDAAYFAHLYDVGCVEDALTIGAADVDRFTLVKDGVEDVASPDWTSERGVVRFRSARQPARRIVDPRGVLAAFAAGYTLNIKDAGAYHPPLGRVCSELQSQFGFHVQANVYFTPPRARGFGLHYDTHDTLIVQIEGEKRWRTYDPVVELPLETQPFSAARHDGKLGEPRELTLAAGDSLYVPHGFPHEAVAGDRRSLHITFAIAPVRVVDLLEALVALAALGNVDLRRALPPGWQHDPVIARSLSALFAQALPRALTPERIPLAAALVENEQFAATRTPARGTFAALEALERGGPQQRVRLRDDAPFTLRDRGASLDVVLAGKVVTLAGAMRAGFHRLAAGPVTFAELEQLLPPGTVDDFLRMLVTEVLVTIDDQRV